MANLYSFKNRNYLCMQRKSFIEITSKNTTMHNIYGYNLFI